MLRSPFFKTSKIMYKMTTLKNYITKGIGKVKKALSFKTEGQADIKTPLNQKNIFILKYKTLAIGELTLVDGVWTFTYTDAFKAQSKIEPLPDFPDVNKAYKKEDELHPFFLIRIPSLKQPSVQEIIKKKKIDANNEVELLKTFGYKSIANPFLLTPA